MPTGTPQQLHVVAVAPRTSQFDAGMVAAPLRQHDMSAAGRRCLVPRRAATVRWAGARWRGRRLVPAAAAAAMTVLRTVGSGRPVVVGLVARRLRVVTVAL